MAPLRASAAAAGGAFIYCPFPRADTNWRIPASVLMACAAAFAMLSMIKRWKDGLLTGAFLSLVAGGIYFYIMIVDANATRQTADACAKGLTALGFAASAGVTCSLAPAVAICVLDAALSLLLVYSSTVLYANCRRVAQEAAEYKARAPLRAATASAAREAFSAGAGDDPAPPPRPFT